MAHDPVRRRLALRSDYRAAFASPAGRRVLKDLYRFCRMDQPTFAGDPHVTAFNEGCRRVFLRILGFMRMSEDDIVKLATEMDDE